MKVALCMIIKLENKYLKEYIEYYKNRIGIDHIYIYDNNNLKGDYIENIHEITQEYEDNNFITVIDVRGKIGYQAAAYQECYNKYGELYDYICFFDADEFLELQNFKNIQEFLNQEKFKNFKCIVISWVCYGDSEKLYYENKSVQERFTIPVYGYDRFYDNTCVKSIIKTGISNLIWDLRHPHANVHIPNVLFNINGNFPLLICDIYGNNARPQYQNNDILNDNLFYNVHLKHYWSKSTEEFMLKRLRGYPCQLGLYNFNLDKEIDDYFRRNRFSMKKLHVLLNT